MGASIRSLTTKFTKQAQIPIAIGTLTASLCVLCVIPLCSLWLEKIRTN